MSEGGPDAADRLRALAAMRAIPGAPRLAQEALSAQLVALPGWACADNAIAKTYRFADYYQTMAFVNAVAYVAHRDDHHPDLAVGYNRCTVAYTTHDAGGVTLNDCIGAAKVERLVA